MKSNIRYTTPIPRKLSLRNADSCKFSPSKVSAIQTFCSNRKIRTHSGSFGLNRLRNFINRTGEHERELCPTARGVRGCNHFNVVICVQREREWEGGREGERDRGREREGGREVNMMHVHVWMCNVCVGDSIRLYII